MSTKIYKHSSLLARLDAMNLSQMDRIVAEAHAQRGEFVAELVIRAARAVRAVGQAAARGVLTLVRPRQPG